MDNRGYERDRGGYGYSTKPYYVEADIRTTQVPAPPPPEYEYRHRRRRYSSSESSASSDSKYNVEDPPDGGQWAWIVVLACAVLHLCYELTYYMFYNTTVIHHYRLKRLIMLQAQIDQKRDTPYTDTMVFEDARLMGEFVAAVASVYVGYRVVAAFGSLCVLGGFLGASFLNAKDDIELFHFCVGFLGGLGASFWRFTAYVAIMEYFKRHRLTALILSGFGRVIGIFVGYGILAQPLRMVRDSDTTEQELQDMTDWHIYYKCQCVMAGVAFFTSFVITPLDLVKAHRRDQCGIAFRIGNMSLCRGGMLFLVLSVYFIYYFGENIPAPAILPWMMKEQFSTTNILAALFTLACGVFLGYFLLAFWPMKKKLYGTLLWMGVFCLVLGLVTLQIPVFEKQHLSYVAVFMAILGAAQVLFETVLRYVIPIAFGRQYIRWIEGLLGLMAGGATIANNFIAKELVKKSPKMDENVFYFAGSAFLGAGLLAVVTINILTCFKFKDKNLEKQTTEQDRELQPRSGKDLGRSTRRDDPYGYYNR